MLTCTSFTGVPDTGKAYEIGDDSGIAITAVLEANGNVSGNTDTAITINTADSVTFSIPEEKCDTIGKQMDRSQAGSKLFTIFKRAPHILQVLFF